MWDDAPNVGALWGSLIVEELARNGVDYVVVAPGSRSTPLVQAAARNEAVRCTVCVDERSAGFHALGWARATGQAAAVITTSGTAVANLLPAVVEASQDGVPLILLTADRPPELREVGANQSIRQTGLFGDTLRWSFDLPCPDDRIPARMVLTTVDHAVQSAVGTPPGPVQLNCPFREPLVPVARDWDRACLDGLDAWRADPAPFTRVHAFDACPWGSLAIESLAQTVRGEPNGLLVAGTARRFTDAAALEELARHLGWPLWADVRSGLRLGADLPHHLPHADRLLGTPGGLAPRVVIQVGARCTSRRIEAYLEAGHVERHVLVDPDPARHDPAHRVTERLVADAEHFCSTLSELLEKPAAAPQPPTALVAADARIEAALDDAIDAGGQASEPWVVRWLSRHVDPTHGLFVSNSLPIRDLQAYGARDGPPLAVAANRGASGIDGIVSTATGYAQGRGSPTTLLIGDLALLHDVGALATLPALEQPVTIIVLNNGGGGVFSFLPIADHADVLTPYVEAPHAIRFEGVCASFDLAYAAVSDRKAFANAYAQAVASGRSSVIEVRSDLASNRREHERIEAAVAAARDEVT